MTDVRANRRRRALEAADVLRYQWTPKADGQDDVEETAARLWQAREKASWEALRLCRLWWWLRLRSVGSGGIRTAKAALKGDPGTWAERTEALERQRAYGSDMDRQVGLCRRDATVLLAASADREAGVQAPMALTECVEP